MVLSSSVLVACKPYMPIYGQRNPVQFRPGDCHEAKSKKKKLKKKKSLDMWTSHWGLMEQLFAVLSPFSTSCESR